jgi:pimeloyl-ACP methyl ester carboxylesterase
MSNVEADDLVERKAHVYDEEVEWHVVGGGSPLVCIHGLGGSSRWWLPVLPELAAEHEMHLIDLPRFSMFSDFEPDDASEWLEQWLEAAGLEAPSLMGHSLGGLLAAELAARIELDRLVLVAPAGLPTGRSAIEELIALVNALRQTDSAFLARIGVDVLRWGPEALWRGMRYVFDADLTAQLELIEAPTLLVWGEEDDLVPVAQAETWQQAIPDARLVVLPETAHIPMVESPDAFADAVLEFLGAAIPQPVELTQARE